MTKEQREKLARAFVNALFRAHNSDAAFDTIDAALAEAFPEGPCDGGHDPADYQGRTTFCRRCNVVLYR